MTHNRVYTRIENTHALHILTFLLGGAVMACLVCWDSGFSVWRLLGVGLGMGLVCFSGWILREHCYLRKHEEWFLMVEAGRRAKAKDEKS